MLYQLYSEQGEIVGTPTLPMDHYIVVPAPQATADAALWARLRPHLGDILNAVDVYRAHLANCESRLPGLDVARNIIAAALKADVTKEAADG